MDNSKIGGSKDEKRTADDRKKREGEAMFSVRNLKQYSIIALICTASFAAAQQASISDKHFVKEALEGGNAEVSLGQLAQEKAMSTDVKEFGQKMVNDHTKLGEQMRPIAQQIGVEPPTGTPISEKALATKLNLLSGDAFDRAYIRAMVKDHREDVKAFKKEVSTGKNPAVKAAAKDGLAVVEGHLRRIEEIAATHKVNVSTY